MYKTLSCREKLQDRWIWRPHNDCATDTRACRVISKASQLQARTLDSCGRRRCRSDCVNPRPAPKIAACIARDALLFFLYQERTLPHWREANAVLQKDK